MLRLGEQVRRDVRYGVRPGVYAIALIGDGVLLTLQDGAPPELQLPGGGVDPGEPALRALHREVREETGWRIAEIRRIGAYRRFSYMPDYDLWAEKVCAVYIARAVRRLGAPAEPGHEAVVLPLDAAVRLVKPPGDRAMLERVAASRFTPSRHTGRRRPKDRR